MAAEFYIEDTSENEKPACVQSGLGEVALSPGSTYIDQEVRRMEIDEIIARLVQRGVLDSNSASLERAGTVLEWADNAMSEFAEFKSVLGDNVPTGLASYMRENSMSAEEYGSTYSEEVNRHVKAFTVSCLNEMMPRIKTQCSELYERLRAEGVKRENYVYYHDHHNFAVIMTDGLQIHYLPIENATSQHVGVVDMRGITGEYRPENETIAITAFLDGLRCTIKCNKVSGDGVVGFRQIDGSLLESWILSTEESSNIQKQSTHAAGLRHSMGRWVTDSLNAA
jgi:hypothetical protein